MHVLLVNGQQTSECERCIIAVWFANEKPQESEEFESKRKEINPLFTLGFSETFSVSPGLVGGWQRRCSSAGPPESVFVLVQLVDATAPEKSLLYLVWLQPGRK